MAPLKGTEASILVDEHCFDANTSQIELVWAIGEGETTSLASDAMEYIPILSKFTINQNGYFGGLAENGYEKEFWDRLATSGAQVTALIGTSAVGCAAYFFTDAAGMGMNYAFPTNGVVTLNGSWGTSEKWRRGKRLWTGAISATGEKTSVDFGAGGTTGGMAVLHISAISGAATNATIDVESSADNITFASEGTFTVSAIGGYTLTLSGTVGRYLRINLTSLGGATSITCQVVASIT